MKNHHSTTGQNDTSPHTPNCECDAEIDYHLRKFKDSTLHLDRVCLACGLIVAFPCKRVTLSKWRDLLRGTWREVVPL